MLASRRAATLFFASILISAHEPPKPIPSPSQSIDATQISAAAQTVASAIREARPPAETDVGCADRSDQRRSDLCAQWKAADAARDAATYGLWTVILGALSTILLIATLWASIRTSWREYRAYVSLAYEGGATVEAGKKLRLPIRLKNYGKTPALSGYSQGNLLLRPKEWDWSHEKFEPFAAPQAKTTWHPTSTDAQLFFGDREITQAEYDQYLTGDCVIFGRVTVYYKDIFGQARKTSIQFQRHHGDGDVIRPGGPGNQFT